MSTDGSYRRSANLPVVSSVRFSSGPPAKLNGSQMIDGNDGDVVETKKQEEWITSKKVEVKKNRQIETRVKRQVVLEDGRVVEDTGPRVSTNTTEDVTTNEKENTEHRKQGDDPPLGEGWVAIPGAVIVSDKKERTTNTKEERHDQFETEQVDHLGDIDHSQLVRAIKEKGDLRLALVQKGRTWLESANAPTEDDGRGRPRVVHQSSKHKKVVDTEEVDEHSEIKDGKINTETKKTLYREEFNNEESPDDGEFSDEEQRKETSHNFTHTKDENLVEYVAVPVGGTLAQGKKIGEGMHYVSENIEEEREGGEGQEAVDGGGGILVPSSLLGHQHLRNSWTRSAPANSQQQLLASTAKPVHASVRSDALTSRPLDLEQEDETRKLETSKWLESHFGSEDSYRSSEDERHPRRPAVSAGNKGDRSNKGPSQTAVRLSSPMHSAVASPIPSVGGRVTNSPPEGSTASMHGHVGAPTPPPPAPPPPPPKPNRSAHFQGVREWNNVEDTRVYRTEANVGNSNRAPVTIDHHSNQQSNRHGSDLYALPDRRAKMSGNKLADGAESTPALNVNGKPAWRRTSETPVQQSPFKQEYDRIARQVKADEEREITNYRRPNDPMRGDDDRTLVAGPGRTTIGSSSARRTVSKSTSNLYSDESSQQPPLTTRPIGRQKLVTSSTTMTSPPRRPAPPPTADISYSTASPPQKPERRKKKSVSTVKQHLHDTLTSTGGSPMEADKSDERRMLASSSASRTIGSSPTSRAEAAVLAATPISSKHGDLRSVTYAFQSPAGQHGKAPSSHAFADQQQQAVQRPARQSSPAKRQAKSESFRRHHNQHLSSDETVVLGNHQQVQHQPLKETRSDPDQPVMRWPFQKSDNGTQTMPKHPATAATKYRHGQPDGAAFSKPRMQQYYLGEDPFKAPLFSPQDQDRQYANVRNVRKEVRMLQKTGGSPSSAPLRTVTTATITTSASGSRRGSSEARPAPPSSATLDRNWKAKQGHATEAPLASAMIAASASNNNKNMPGLEQNRRRVPPSYSADVGSVDARSQTLPRKPSGSASSVTRGFVGSNLAGSMFNISTLATRNSPSAAEEHPLQRRPSGNSRQPTTATVAGGSSSVSQQQQQQQQHRVNRSQSFNVAGALSSRPQNQHGLKYTNSTRIDITGYSPLLRKSTSSSLQRLNDAAEPLKSPDVLKIVRTASLRRGLDSADGADQYASPGGDAAVDGRYGSGTPNGWGKTPAYAPKTAFSSPLASSSNSAAGMMRSSSSTLANNSKQQTSFATSSMHLQEGLSSASTRAISAGRSAQTSGTEDNNPKKQKFLQGLLNTAPELFQHIHGEPSRPVEDEATIRASISSISGSASTSAVSAGGGPTSARHTSTSPRQQLMSSISGLGTGARPSEVKRTSSSAGYTRTQGDDDECAGKATSPLLLERIKSPTPPKSNESFARITTSSSPAPSSRVSETVEISRSPEGYRTVTKSIVRRSIVPSSTEVETTGLKDKDPHRPKYSESIKGATQHHQNMHQHQQPQEVFIQVRSWNSR